MLKTILLPLLPLLVFFGNGSGNLLTRLNENVRQDSGTLQKMIVANGSVAMDLYSTRLVGGTGSAAAPAQLRFRVENDSFFTVLIYNDELRGPSSGSMGLVPQSSAALPGSLGSALDRLAVEYLPAGGDYEMGVRDSRTGFTFFNIEGYETSYDPGRNMLGIHLGRMLMSPEYAAELGRPKDAGTVVGQISISANLRTIEVIKMVEGEVVSNSLPAMSEGGLGGVPGPDVIVGNLSGLAQFGTSGTRVGLAVGTDSCNAGLEQLNWLANPNNDHPVIPQNLYRMSGGAANNERFEQIGHSQVKHAFTALQNDICGFGCTPSGTGTRLGIGCSDPYGASLNAGPNLGSKAWINPFTGFYPRNDSATPNNNHTGHAHDGTSHRVLVEMSDLNTSLNPGASYYTEAQYVTPHEYNWCQTHPGQCNMYNNVSYRKYNVTGTGSPFSFSPAAPTERTKPAITAWPGATIVEMKPAPGVDGVAMVAYKVTNPSAGVWHYEYAVYNQNLDRAIQSFGVSLGAGATVSNIGFHAPPQHPGWAMDGTVANSGFSSAPWAQTLTDDSMTWNSETFAQNANANAIRWSTMYNFRFDSNKPPQIRNATVGFFKTGEPMVITVLAPAGPSAAVTVSGRVAIPGGRGLYNARVRITDSGGITRTEITNPFGYYRFENVTSGAFYTISVDAKRYNFTPQVVPVTDNLTVDFLAQP